jgi:hypothetical protein
MSGISRVSVHLVAAILAGWVVWVQARKSDLDLDSKRPPMTIWDRVTKDSTSYGTVEECEQVLALQADVFEIHLKSRSADVKRHGKLLLSHDDTSLYAHHFHCLPDTVDPRRPKGR